MLGTRTIALIGFFTVALGCASSAGSLPQSTPPVAPPPAPIGWPVRTAEYVDLWLHGFALINADTAKVPLYQRGYRNRMLALRRERNVITALDANQSKLAAGLERNPGLAGGQFAVFGFNSFDEAVRVTQLFVQGDGSPGTVNDPGTKQLFLWLQQYFKTVADRDWLRLFVLSLQEEQTRFYNSYWTAVQGDRAPVRQQINNLWTTTYRTKFTPFLRNTRLVDGTIILSLPIEGEGRTVTDPALGNGIAVSFPATSDSAVAAIYTLAHELVGTASAVPRALEDNTTPAEQRAGVIDRIMPIATVRGGAILLQRMAPELVTGYEQYYLHAIGAAVPAGDPSAAFVAAFALTDAQRDGIIKQIELILAGI
jgi:hypothetical protein